MPARNCITGAEPSSPDGFADPALVTCDLGGGAPADAGAGVVRVWPEATACFWKVMALSALAVRRSETERLLEEASVPRDDDAGALSAVR